MKLKILIALGIVALFGWRAEAQIYDTNGDYVQTFAGSGFSGYVDGVGQQTMFKNPTAIVADSQSNLFVWDAGNAVIRKITPDGTVSTFATNNLLSGLGDFAGMTIDSSNVIWIANGLDIYRIETNADLSRFSLYPTISGTVTGGICIDSTGEIYVTAGNRIYKCNPFGTPTVFVGSGNTGQADGNGIFTSFAGPTSLAIDHANNIYVSDGGVIRRIDQSQNVITLTGSAGVTSADGYSTNAVFNNVHQMIVDDFGNLIISCGTSVRKLSASNYATTIAGFFGSGGFYAEGPGNVAKFDGAYGVCVSGNTIFVADCNNQRIRSITNNPVPQIVSAANLGIGTFAGVTITGTVGRTYQIQSSPDFNAWTTRATILLNASPYLWIDTNPVAGNKFYRALLMR